MEGELLEYAVKPRTGRTRDPYKALACAVVLKAVEDYKHYECYRNEVRGFLLSGFCELIDMNGSVILERLDSELEKKRGKRKIEENRVIIEVYDWASRELLGRYDGYKEAAKAIGKTKGSIQYSVKQQRKMSYGYSRKPMFYFNVIRKKGKNTNVLQTKTQQAN